MKKYYSNIYSGLILLFNIFCIHFLFTSDIIVEKEYVLYFFSWYSSFITGFFTIEIKTKVPYLMNHSYYALFPLCRNKLLLKEFLYFLSNYSFLIIITSSCCTLLLFSLHADINLMIFSLSIILTTLINLIVLVFFRNLGSFMKGISKVQIYNQIVYFFAIIPALLLSTGKVIIDIDGIARFNPLGGGLMFLFLSKLDQSGYTLLVFLFILLAIYAMYKKINLSWDI